MRNIAHYSNSLQAYNAHIVNCFSTAVPRNYS